MKKQSEKQCSYALEEIVFMKGETLPVAITIRANDVLFTFQQLHGEVLLASSSIMHNDVPYEIEVAAQRFFQLTLEEAQKFYPANARVIISRG